LSFLLSLGPPHSVSFFPAFHAFWKLFFPLQLNLPTSVVHPFPSRCFSPALGKVLVGPFLILSIRFPQRRPRTHVKRPCVIPDSCSFPTPLSQRESRTSPPSLARCTVYSTVFIGTPLTFLFVKLSSDPPPLSDVPDFALPSSFVFASPPSCRSFLTVLHTFPHFPSREISRAFFPSPPDFLHWAFSFILHTSAVRLRQKFPFVTWTFYCSSSFTPPSRAFVLSARSLHFLLEANTCSICPSFFFPYSPLHCFDRLCSIPKNLSPFFLGFIYLSFISV